MTRPAPRSSWTIVEGGHGPGRDLAIVSWRWRSGADLGVVRVPVSGLGRIGPVEVSLPVVGGSPNAYEWDTREWQWWRDYPFPPEQMRPREVAKAAGGAEAFPGGVRVWTRFTCDGVETTQEWFFADLPEGADFAYDVLITVRHVGAGVLEDYGQFFASYTAWNGQKGHFYWSSDGSLVNYRERGSEHLDYYVAGKGSTFERQGRVPWCPKGGGLVKATWRHPASISFPSPRGYRHVILSEEARTSALAQGMRGIAQDYLIYPPEGRLAPGQSFTAHVRHLIVKVTEADLPARLETWWKAFAGDHGRVRGMTRIEQ